MNEIQRVQDPNGIIHEFPADATQEDIQRVLRLQVGPIPFEKGLDKSSGALAVARRDVGGASSPQDKLATLKRYYPDAQPYGEDNFVFTDPATGKPTLYNPPGIDVGDIFSVTPEMFEFSGGVAGAAAATPRAVATAPFTGGQSLLAIPAGVGLGAAGGREAENILSTTFGERVDTRRLPQRATDAAVTAASNAVAQKAGDVVAQGAARYLGPPIKRAFTKATPQGITQAFERQAIDPTAGAISGSRPVQIGEQALSATPGGSGVMQETAEKTIAQTGRAAERLAQRTGLPKTGQGMGEQLKTTATELGKKFETRREVLDQAIEDTIGHDTPVRIDRSIGLIRSLYGMLGQAPNTVKPKVGTAIDELRGLLSDAGANLKTGERGNIPFWALRGLRTRIGQMLDAPDITGYSPGAKQTMRKLYAVLAEDIKRAAQSAGPDAVKALRTHDRYVRFNRTQNLPILQELVNKKTDEQAFQWATGQIAQGGSRLQDLRRQVPKEVWDDFVSTIITRMGKAKPGQSGVPLELLGPDDTFSPDVFLTNFNKMSPEAKSVLFGGTRYANLRADLGDLVKITASLKDAAKMANPSGTGRILLYGAALNSLAAGAGAMLTGDATGAMIGVSGAVVAPYVAAKLMTNPRFIKWLGHTGRMGINSPYSVRNSIARLVNIGLVEPEIQDEINQFAAAFRSQVGISDQPAAPVAARSGGATAGLLGPR